LGRSFGTTLLAVREGERLLVSPEWDTPLTTGAVLYYVATSRIKESRLAGAAAT